MSNYIEDTTTIAVEAGMSQKYIDDLTADLQDAKRTRNQYGKAAQKAKSEYEITNNYCSDLSDYVARITSTYNQVIYLEDFINSLITHSDNLCTNVNHTGEAIKLIIECYKCVVEQTEGLKQMVKDLLDAIKKLSNSTLNTEESLVKCLNDLHIQIEETLQVQNTALDSLLLVWRSVTDMEFMICNNQDVEPELGLTYELNQLKSILCCEYCGGSSKDIEPCPVDPDSTQASDEDQIKLCCNDKPQASGTFDPSCTASKPALCAIEGKEGFNSDFFCALETNMTYNCEMAEYLRCVWNYYEKQQKNASAKHDAIDTALTAATDAKNLCN